MPEGRDVGVGKKRRHYTYVSEEEIREAFKNWKQETSSSTLDQELESANRWAAMHGIETPPFPRKRRNLRRILPVRKEAKESTSHRRFRPVVQLVSVLIILVMGGWSVRKRLRMEITQRRSRKYISHPSARSSTTMSPAASASLLM